jgi:hypothetical protein
MLGLCSGDAKVNNEFEMAQKKWVVSNLWFYHQMFLESLRKTMKDLSQFRIEQDTSRYKYETLHVEPSCSIIRQMSTNISEEPLCIFINFTTPHQRRPLSRLSLNIFVHISDFHRELVTLDARYA